MRTVVVTGIGTVSPLGLSMPSTWNALLDQKSGVESIQGLLESAGASQGIQCHVAAAIKHIDDEWREEGSPKPVFDPSSVVPKDQSSASSRFIQFALGAATEALTSAKLISDPSETLTSLNTTRTGVAIGSGMGALDDMSHSAQSLVNNGRAAYRRISAYFVPRILPNMAAGAVGLKYGFQGPTIAPATACAAGAHAIGDAGRLIAWGAADVMIAGGAEACITPLALAGFAKARTLATSANDAPETALRPWDDAREGFVMGEGAAVLVLEDKAHALARGAPILAELSGYGASGDAHHITAPDPEGSGAIRAMTAALEDGGVSIDQIGYVNAHATGTPLGDVAEAKAIASVFSETSTSLPLVSSTKGATGHLLGAAGALEAAITVQALHTGRLPGTLNLAPEAALDAEYPSLLRPQGGKLPLHATAALTNSFGFGGVNASLVFSKITES